MIAGTRLRTVIVTPYEKTRRILTRIIDDVAGWEAEAVEHAEIGRLRSAGEFVSVVADLEAYAAEEVSRLPPPSQGTHQHPTMAGIRKWMIGQSPQIEQLLTMIARAGPLRSAVLITGETGTGKVLVAKAVHQMSGRAHKPFVAVSCAALPETLLESELFGHTKGSFTGALSNRRGLFEQADGGTLFLDEIATISPTVQVKLLRVLQEKTISRAGSERATPVDFRLVAATNVDLASEVAANRFRADLYYRLNVLPIEVPPLRERPGDIPALAEYFQRRFAEENDVPVVPLSWEAVETMVRYSWPGNVRELENFIARYVAIGTHVVSQIATPVLSNERAV